MDTPVLKEFGYINDYSQWDDIINAKVKRFHEVHNVHPNILLASSATFDNIDAYLKEHPENLYYSGDEDEPPTFEGLSTFTAADYSLDFCLDMEQAEHYFILVFDETPTFDGEEEPKAEEEEAGYCYRMAG